MLLYEQLTYKSTHEELLLVISKKISTHLPEQLSQISFQINSSYSE